MVFNFFNLQMIYYKADGWVNLKNNKSDVPIFYLYS